MKWETNAWPHFAKLKWIEVWNLNECCYYIQRKLTNVTNCHGDYAVYWTCIWIKKNKNPEHVARNMTNPIWQCLQRIPIQKVGLLKCVIPFIVRYYTAVGVWFLAHRSIGIVTVRGNASNSSHGAQCTASITSKQILHLGHSVFCSDCASEDLTDCLIFHGTNRILVIRNSGNLL